MTTPPRRHLPPAAQARGRYVAKRLSKIEAGDNVHRVNVGASIQSVASSSHHIAEFKRDAEGRLDHVDEQLEILDDHLENLDVDLDELYEVTLPDLQRRLDDAFDAIEDIDFDTRTNLLVNGDFETGDLTGWKQFDPSLPTVEVIQSDTAYSGEYVAVVTAEDGLSYTEADVEIPASMGLAYLAEIWIRFSPEATNGFVNLLLAVTTTEGQAAYNISSQGSGAILDGEWHRVNGVIALGERHNLSGQWPGGDILSVQLIIGGQVIGEGATVEIDNVQLYDITDEYNIAAVPAAAATETANTALEAAEQAMTVAGSKNTVTYSTGTPIEDGTREGDTYRQRDAQGNIIGEWEWDGDNWQRREISSESISNLDVGKLTAGSAAIDDLVAQRIGAATGEFIELATDQLIASEAGFDTAVANQMFVDIFTANQVTADQIDVNSIASHSGFIDNLFSHNLSLTGELTALSEDFTTVLSQAGVRMFANNSLIYEGDWEVPGGDAFSYGG